MRIRKSQPSSYFVVVVVVQPPLVGQNKYLSLNYWFIEGEEKMNINQFFPFYMYIFENLNWESVSKLREEIDLED